jgi:Flp pilus assembly pilin Flp
MLRNDSGQATAEYALVIVAAAVIALALIVWASSSGVLEEIFDTVARRVLDIAGR